MVLEECEDNDSRSQFPLSYDHTARQEWWLGFLFLSQEKGVRRSSQSTTFRWCSNRRQGDSE